MPVFRAFAAIARSVPMRSGGHASRSKDAAGLIRFANSDIMLLSGYIDYP
jgi:hypothetical protein